MRARFHLTLKHALVLLSLLLTHQLVTAAAYVPDASAFSRIRPSDARKLVAGYKATISACGMCDDIQVGRFHIDGGTTLVLESLEDDRKFTFPLSRAPLTLETTTLGTGVVLWLTPDEDWRLSGWDSETIDQAKRLSDALYVLKYTTKQILDPAVEARFDTIASAYRDADPKPVPNEDIRRFNIQAGSAVRSRNFEFAADLYGQALAIAPWWPAGHFNRALLLGESGEFIEAIVEMRRYLKLVPDAPNARAAQDRIYEWELNVPGTFAKSALQVLQPQAKPRLGVQIIDIPEFPPTIAMALQRANINGVYIQKVWSGSSAAQAGLKTGDVIDMFDEKPVTGKKNLIEAIATAQPGRSIPVRVIRGQEILNLSIVLPSVESGRQTQ